MIPGHSKKTISLQLAIPSTVSELTHDFTEPVCENKVLDTFKWGWKNGHVDIEARLPKSGFNSGDF
jgi:hypothetical protein